MCFSIPFSCKAEPSPWPGQPGDSCSGTEGDSAVLPCAQLRCCRVLSSVAALCSSGNAWLVFLLLGVVPDGALSPLASLPAAPAAPFHGRAHCSPSPPSPWDTFPKAHHGDI